MADIGRLGIDTAAAVVERILELSRRAGDVRLPMLSPTADGDSARRLRADAERLIDLYAEWTRGVVEAALDMAAGATGAGRDILSIGPVTPGTSATATAWLHVVDAVPKGATVAATVLSGHDGVVIPASCVRCDPPVLDTSAGSHEVAVTVAIPAGTAAGRYHGHLLAAGLTDVALALRVDVES